jgi:hypothetical protein
VYDVRDLSAPGAGPEAAPSHSQDTPADSDAYAPGGLPSQIARRAESVVEIPTDTVSSRYARNEHNPVAVQNRTEDINVLPAMEVNPRYRLSATVSGGGSDFSDLHLLPE